MELIKVLCSGSKGNSTLIKYKGNTYIIDIGVTCKKFMSLVDEYSDLENTSVFISHTHSDHIKGLKVFSKNSRAKIYGSSSLMNQGYDVEIITKKIQVNDIYVEPLFLSHDCSETLGYIFYLGAYKIVYVSDTGFLSDTNLELMKNPDVLMLEANHDVDMLMSGSYSWPLKKRVVGDSGHLSNIQFKSYVKNIIGENTKHLVALHLSEENNDYAIVDKMMRDLDVDNCQVATQEQGCNAIKLNWRK